MRCTCVGRRASVICTTAIGVTVVHLGDKYLWGERYDHVVPCSFSVNGIGYKYNNIV
jgi:hypothetical protein